MNVSVHGGGHVPGKPKKTIVERLREILHMGLLITREINLLRRIIVYFETPALNGGIDRGVAGELRQVAEENPLPWENAQALHEAADHIEGRPRNE